MIPRLIEKLVFNALLSYQKLIFVLGARQVGKTILLNSIKDKLTNGRKSVLYLNCDLEEDRNSLDTTSKTLLAKLISGTDFLFIDEAQRLTDPGLTLKIIHDNFKSVKVLATGSSSFELKNKITDALTGRYLDFCLYPLSFAEILNYSPASGNQVLRKNTADSILSEILLYGSYPEIYLTGKTTDKSLFLEKIVQSYLFKDILSFQKVRNSQAIRNLAKALAYQIGSIVSENELANRLHIDRKTVISYLNILEKSYVITRIYPYSKNPRREIGRNYKIYFNDLGIRNSLIGDFNDLALRLDNGFLWENFLFVERIKLISNHGNRKEVYFWRSYAGSEIDYLEKTSPSRINAYEFKYRQKTISRGALQFARKYKTKVKLINRSNYLDFITSSKIE